MDGRVLHDASLRKMAAELYEKGYGWHSIATFMGIPGEAVREWIRTYRSVGIEGLLTMGTKKTYPFETKVAAVRAVVEDGMTKVEAMERFGIASMTPLKSWIRTYRAGGPEALRPKPKGRPKGSKVQPEAETREQELERRVRKLEAENAYLKKSIALKAEKRSRTARRPRS